MRLDEAIREARRVGARKIRHRFMLANWEISQQGNDASELYRRWSDEQILATADWRVVREPMEGWAYPAELRPSPRALPYVEGQEPIFVREVIEGEK